MNDENLKKGKKFSNSDENARKRAQELGAKGGKKKGENAKRRKTLKETTRLIMNMSVASGKPANIDDMSSIDEIAEANISAEERIIMVAVAQAMNGDAKARNFLFKALGEQQEQASKDALEKLDEVLAEIGGVI